ncbi:MAG: NTP transferase domain-containing protein [Bowdeniella nasicola]|nr:NTP transferase domain-containing protein [Bowdeniella nasicola]
MPTADHPPVSNSLTPLAAVVVLAAGAGTRMKSSLPKVLHRAAGRTLLQHAITAGRALTPQRLCVVVRHEREQVASHALECDADIVIADQDDIPGTGRAVQCALTALGEIDGDIVVTAGDTPLLDGELLRELLAAHRDAGNMVTVLSATLTNPFGYGRIVREGERVIGIVEEKDASATERKITEINTATYVFDANTLREMLTQVDQDNAQGEVYLTDVIALAAKAGRRVGSHQLADAKSAEGANDRAQLAELDRELNQRTLLRWMRQGVSVIDPATTRIDMDVSLGANCTIYPYSQLLGATTIAEDVVIGPYTTVSDCEIGAGAQLVRTQAELSLVGPGATVGPFTSLGAGSRVGDNQRIAAHTHVAAPKDE